MARDLGIIAPANLATPQSSQKDFGSVPSSLNLGRAALSSSQTALDNVNKQKMLLGGGIGTPTPNPTLEGQGDVGVGLAKGVGSTLKNLGTFGQTLANQTIGRVANLVSGKGFIPTQGPLFPTIESKTQGDIYSPGTPAEIKATQTLTPSNDSQNFGFGAEKFAEFALPQAAAFKLPGFANMASQFALNAGVKATQGGSISDDTIAGGIGALTAGIAPLAEILKPTFLKGMSFISGYNDNVLKAAFERTPGAVETAQNGESSLNSIVRKTAANLSDYANKTLQAAKDTVAKLSKLSGGGRGYPGTRQAILEQGRNFVENATTKLRDMNIGVNNDGTLVFDRNSMPSNIVSKADQGAIQDAFGLLQGLKKDTSIENIDAILERMLSLKAKTPAGSPTGGETRKIIGNIMNEVVGFTKSIGSSVSPAYGQYAQFLEQNLPERVFINDAKEMFGSSAHLSAKETSQIGTHLLQLFNSGKSEVKDFANQVGEKVGTDPVGASAGTLIKEGDQISARAKNLTTRGIVEKAFEAIPRTIVRQYIKSGNITALEQHPIISMIANLTGASAKVIAQEVASFAEGSDD